MRHIYHSYTPQKKGVIESNNYTLTEVVNYMIHYQGLSSHFLVKTIDYGNYIVNCIYTKGFKRYNIEIIM